MIATKSYSPGFADVVCLHCKAAADVRRSIGGCDCKDSLSCRRAGEEVLYDTKV